MQVQILSGIYVDAAPAELRTALPRNLVPVPKDSGVSKGYMAPAPGLEAFTLGATPGIGRGGIVWQGAVYRVLGTKLCQVSETGVVTVLGDVGGTGPVSLDFSFDRLAIASGGNLFYWNGGALTQVTDPDLGTVKDMLWVGGYFMTTDGEYLVVTELNDPTSVDPLKYGSAESDPDPIVAIKKLRNEVIALGRNTCQFFQNVGGDGFPFQQVAGAQIQRGCIGVKTCALFMESIAFLGSGRNEAPAVYIAGGGTSQKLSTREIDVILAGYSEAQLAASEMEVRIEKAHQLLHLHLPDRTLVFDGAASAILGAPVWFELGSATSGRGQYRARHFVWAYDRWTFDDPQVARVGRLVDTHSLCFGQATDWEFSTPILYNESRGGIIHQMELVALPGRISTGSPTVSTAYTLDGTAWSPEQTISAGGPGDTLHRICWRRQGKMRNWRIQRFKGSSASHMSILRLELQVEPLGA